MPRPIRPWFRFYVETFSDRKVRRLPPAQRWLWAAILGAARESCEPGSLYVAPDLPMSHQELADYAGVPARDVREGLEAMVRMSMVTVEDELVRVTNWNARQFESDDVTRRTRDHRERSKEPGRNVPRNAPETETETETEKTPATAAAAADIEREFAEWYAVYPLKKGRGQALRAYKAARKKAGADVLLAAIHAQAPAIAGRKPEYRPHPATWLNGERWADEPETPVATVRHLQPAELVESPPDGLSDEEYLEWHARQRARRS